MPENVFFIQYIFLELKELRKGTCGHSDEPSEFHTMLGNCWVAELLAASQKGLGSMELVNYKGLSRHHSIISFVVECHTHNFVN